MSDITPEMVDAFHEAWTGDARTAIAAALAVAPTVTVECPTCHGAKRVAARRTGGVLGDMQVGCPDCNSAGKVRAVVIAPRQEAAR